MTETNVSQSVSLYYWPTYVISVTLCVVFVISYLHFHSMSYNPLQDKLTLNRDLPSIVCCLNTHIYCSSHTLYGQPPVDQALCLFGNEIQVYKV